MGTARFSNAIFTNKAGEVEVKFNREWLTDLRIH